MIDLFNYMEKKKLELIIRFFRFLKENDAFVKYKVAYYSKGNDYRVKNWDILTFLINCYDFHNFLGGSFNWVLTKEKNEYWRSIFIKWHSINTKKI